MNPHCLALPPRVRETALLACVAVLTSCAWATPAGEPIASPAAVAFIDSVRNARSIPGMAITVKREGNTVFSEGFGFADLEEKVAAAPDTRFRVGSVSKVFTAMALMRLAEEGVIDVNASIRNYAPLDSARWPDVTARQLAGHVAGVRHYRGNEFFSRVEYPSLHDALQIFIRDSLLFPPGSRYAYSSYGYNLLGAAMESATHEPFPALMSRLVLEPLRMTSTVPDSAGREIRGRATLYMVRDDSISVAPADNLSSRWPSGGYLSSTEDMARAGETMVFPGFLTAETITSMLTPQRLTSGEAVPVGIAWRIGFDRLGRRIAHHGGTSNGGSAFILVYPDERLVIAVAANVVSGFGEPETMRLAEFFLPGERQP